MPATTTYNPERDGGELKVWLKSGDLEKCRSVYFTDQSPRFKVVIENVGDGPVEGPIITRLDFEESEEVGEHGTHNRENIDLDPGEKHTFTHEVDILPYQGTAALTVDRVRLRDRGDQIEMRTGTGTRLARIYTFMVYDRDYYKVNYLRPRYAQYISAGLAVLIVALGVIQLVAAS